METTAPLLLALLSEVKEKLAEKQKKRVNQGWSVRRPLCRTPYVGGAAVRRVPPPGRPARRGREGIPGGAVPRRCLCAAIAASRPLSRQRFGIKGPWAGSSGSHPGPLDLPLETPRAAAKQLLLCRVPPTLRTLAWAEDGRGDPVWFKAMSEPLPPDWPRLQRQP